MDLWKYNRLSPPSVDDIERIGNFLLGKLSKFLNIELKFFKLHIVDSESFVGTFRNVTPIFKVLNIQIEGVILYQIRDGKPNINAELLLFAGKMRAGLQKHSGKSFFLFDHNEDSGWTSTTWMMDDVDDWEKVKEVREIEYSKVKKTYDD